jgi:hypothetical protein
MYILNTLATANALTFDNSILPAQFTEGSRSDVRTNNECLPLHQRNRDALVYLLDKTPIFKYVDKFHVSKR